MGWVCLVAWVLLGLSGGSWGLSPSLPGVLAQQERLELGSGQLCLLSCPHTHSLLPFEELV